MSITKRQAKQFRRAWQRHHEVMISLCRTGDHPSLHDGTYEGILDAYHAVYDLPQDELDAVQERSGYRAAQPSILREFADTFIANGSFSPLEADAWVRLCSSSSLVAAA